MKYCICFQLLAAYKDGADKDDDVCSEVSDVSEVDYSTDLEMEYGGKDAGQFRFAELLEEDA